MPPVPGANLFLSNGDATTAPDEHGNRTVTCQPLDSVPAARAAYGALRVMLRLAAEL